MARGKKQCVTKKDVKKLIKQDRQQTNELKYFNQTSVFASLLSSTGVLESVSNVARGASDSQRDGDRLLPTSLRISYSCFGESLSFQFRFIVLRWIPDDTGLAPTVPMILQNSASGFSVNSDYVHDQRGQFNILYDKTHTISNNGNELLHKVINVKMAKKQMDYTAAGIGGANKIYVLGITDRSLATSGTAQYVSRLNYYDN